MFSQVNDITKEIEPFNMLFVGVGNAGCNVLDALQDTGRSGPYSIAIHSSHQKLSQTRVMRSLQIGSSVTEGASAGGDPKLGRICAESDEDVLRELFGGYELILFITGLGGGTGSGATPTLLRFARESGCFTLCLATLPFKFEADDKRRKADMALTALHEQSHGVIAFPNERLFELLGGRRDLKRGIKAVESYLIDIVLGIWDMLNQRGLINLDFGDLTSLVQNSGGSCTMACVAADGNDAVEQVCSALLESPLLDNGSVFSGAAALMISIKGGSDLALDEVERTTRLLVSRSREDVKVAVGVTIEEEWTRRLQVMLIVSEAWLARSSKAPNNVRTGGDEAATEIPEGDGKSPLVQAEIALDTPSGKGKFVNVAPTVHQGEDLDVPTFIRRGIKLSRTY